MKLFGWMQSKLSGKQAENKRPNTSSLPATTTTISQNQIIKKEAREEFNDWPHGLLAIGTFGKNEMRENNSNEIGDIQESDQENNIEEAPSSPTDALQDFSPEEIGKLQKELTKLLTRKSNHDQKEKEIANLPLDRFLNCPSSLEVDRRISKAIVTSTTTSDDHHVDESEVDDIERTISVILGRCKDICESKKKKSIGKKSISFLLKKMFVCRGGFAPQPSIRDTFQESRMEKLLRTLLNSKKINQQYASRQSSMKKHLEDKKEDEVEKRHKTSDGSKWDKTDSEYIVLEI